MKFEFTPRIDGFYEVRSLPSVRAVIDQQLQRVAGSAGEGYEWESHQGARSPQGRWRGTVYPNTWKARQDNARNNTLVRTLGGG